MTRSLIERDSIFWKVAKYGVVVLLYFLIPHPNATRAVMAEQDPQIPTIRVETDLVEVPVTVTDRKGRAITGLTARDFHIYEDGVEQILHHFTSEPGPVSFGLILDRSASMARMMQEVYSAAIHMVESATPGSEAFIMTFSDQTKLILGFTADRSRMRTAVAGLESLGATALWDAVGDGLNEMKKAGNNRKALIVVTDGDDNQSKTDPKELIERVKESDVLVYSVAMEESDGHGRPFWIFGGWTKGVLISLAESSGAYAHRPRSVEECKKDMQRIASEVSHQYILGFYPRETTGPSRFRKLEVVVRPPRDTSRPVVRARRGYYGQHNSVGRQMGVDGSTVEKERIGS